MPARNVRVEIPIGSPLKMIELTDDIIARHTELLPASPLDIPEIDMAGLATKHGTHVTGHHDAKAQHAAGEALMMEANTALGTAPGQTVDTEGTVQYHVARIRNRLLVAHKTIEEELSNYGFNVVVDVTKGRKTVRVDIPINNARKMIELVDDIIEHHNNLGPGSPLNTPEIDMTELGSVFSTFQDKRKLALKQHRLGETSNQIGNRALGTGKGQTMETEGTVYNIIGIIRDHLLLVHQNFEEELSTYGFNVVISMTPFPGEEEPTIIEGNVNAGETLGIFDKLEDTTSLLIENTGSVALTFCRMESESMACDPIAHLSLNPGEDASVVGTDLGATGEWLNVSNLDASSGNFRVTVE